jgi:hypothetical protein
MFLDLRQVGLVRNYLHVVAADSGAAILNERYEPLQIVAACAVLVAPPYRQASSFLAEPIFAGVENGHMLVIHELELCLELLKTVKADVIHLDMSLGRINIEELSAVSLSKMRISNRAHTHLLRILPKIRKLAADAKRTYNVDVLAIGKESIPVRIAELTSGAHAVIYTVEKAVKDGKPLRLGLPTTCRPKILEDGVYLESLLPAEHDVIGYAKDENKILEKVQLTEMSNPCARGFRLLEISPKV